MKVKIEKVNFKNENSFFYEVFTSEKRKRFSGDVWVSVHTFFPSPYRSDEETKEIAIKCADNILKPKQPIKLLKLNEIIYEKSN